MMTKRGEAAAIVPADDRPGLENAAGHGRNGIGCERTKSRRTRERTATGCVRQGTACGSNGERFRSYLDEAGLVIVRTEDGHR